MTLRDHKPDRLDANSSFRNAESPLRVDDLRVRIGRGAQAVQALRGVSLDLYPETITGLVGESGCGKTMTGLSILRLLPKGGRVVGGRILFGGQDLTTLTEAEMRDIRGARISMIFQNAERALNPLFTVGDQIARVYRLHEDVGRKEAWDKAIEMLDRMGIPDADQMAQEYPHRYSGGMAQRAMIAMALVCSPQLLVADEPTTGLDVTIEAQVLDLIVRVVREAKASMLLISHDMGVIARTCQHVAVMYAGEIVEYGPIDTIFGQPRHPYTQGLLSCVEVGDSKRMRFVPGTVPDLRQPLDFCAFADRCQLANEVCWAKAPGLQWVSSYHAVGCHMEERVVESQDFTGNAGHEERPQ